MHPTPVILPWTADHAANERRVPTRFVLPAIEESDAPRATWPRIDEERIGPACAKAAENILELLPAEPMQWIALTSPTDGEGKTDLLIALAPALAKRSSGGVLAVDANFNHPDLTTRLRANVPSDLNGPNPILPTDLPGLSFLPAPTFRKSRAWGFDPMNDSVLCRGWSLALVELPALVHSDAIRFAHRCDGIILAARLGRATRRTVGESIRAVRSAGGRVLACLAVE